MPDTDIVPQSTRLIKPDFHVLNEVLWHFRLKRAYLVWRAREKDDGSGFDKIPCDPVDGAFRKPNTASDRAILTLEEAQEAIERLRAEGQEVGLGMMPHRAGLVAGDFDGVIKVNGAITVMPWASAAALGTYWERSPGGSGMRVLYKAVPELLDKVSNGVERGKVGIYGRRCNRFVTLTGAGDIVSITEMTEPQAEALLKRWTDAGTRVWTPSEKNDGYPSGAEGMALAAEDIVSGAALHPALSAWLVRAVRVMPIDVAEDKAWELFHQSAAQHLEPDRWFSRMTSIPGLLKWIRERGGFRREQISPQRLQGIRQKLAALQVQEPEAEQDEPGSFTAYLREFCAAEGMEVGDLDDLTLEVLRADWAGVEPDWMQNEMAEIAMEQAEAEELAEAKTDYHAREGNDPDRHRWMLDIPSVWTQKLARTMHQRMAYDMPGAAVVGAITCMSVIASNRYCAVWSHETSLNCYSAIMAPTGAGKDSILKALEQAAQSVEVASVGSLTSGAALHGALNRNPRILLSIDEWAKILRGQQQDKSGNSMSLGALTLSVFERGMDVLPAKGYSQRGADKPAVAFPYVVTFGATTGSVLTSVLSKEMIRDGTLNRSYIIDAENGSGGRWPVKHRRPEINPLMAEIAQNLSMAAFLGQPQHRKRTFEQRVYRENEDGVMQWFVEAQVMVEVHIPEDYWEWFRAELDMLERELGPLAEIASRYERNAAVLATLLRVGDYVEALDDPAAQLVVTEAQAKWAIRFLTQTIRELAVKFTHYVPEGESDGVMADVRDKLIRALEPGTRDTFCKRNAKALDEGLVPIAVLSRMFGKNRMHEDGATIQRMLDRGWMMELPDDEREAYYSGKKGRPSRRLFRVLPGLYL